MGNCNSSNEIGQDGAKYNCDNYEHELSFVVCIDRYAYRLPTVTPIQKKWLGKWPPEAVALTFGRLNGRFSYAAICARIISVSYSMGLV